jgi:hypothetical protein
MKTLKQAIENLERHHKNIVTEQLLTDIVNNLDKIDLNELREFLNEKI